MNNLGRTTESLENKPDRHSWGGKLLILLEMIKIEHTVFALPFAFMGALLAARGLPTAREVRFYFAGHDWGPQCCHGLQPAGGPTL